MEVQTRIQTVNQQSGEAALACVLQLPSTDMTEMEIETWCTNGNPNIYIFEEELNKEQCENLIKKPENPVNCLACIAGGRAHFPIRSDLRVITVFFEGKNEATITRAISVKTIEAPSFSAMPPSGVSIG